MVYPDPTNPGYFDPTAPAFNSTIGVNKVDVVVSSAADGRVVNESFTKGGSGPRDPVLTDYVFPSYLRNANHPMRVFRNGVRQIPSSYVEKTWSTLGDDKDWGIPYMSDDGTNIVVGCLTDSTIWCSSDSGTTWYVTPPFDPNTIGRPYQVVGNRDGTVVVALMGVGDGSTPGSGTLYWASATSVVQAWSTRSWGELISAWDPVIGSDPQAQKAAWHSIAYSKDTGRLIGVISSEIAVTTRYIAREGTGWYTTMDYQCALPVAVGNAKNRMMIAVGNTNLLMVVVGTDAGLYYTRDGGGEGSYWALHTVTPSPITAVGISDDGAKVVWANYFSPLNYSLIFCSFNATTYFTLNSQPVTVAGQVLSIAFFGGGSGFFYTRSGSTSTWKSTDFATAIAIDTGGYYPGNIVCAYSGGSYFMTAGLLSSTIRFPLSPSGVIGDGYAPYAYSRGGLLRPYPHIEFFTDVPALEPSEVVTLEYLTESTTLLPTLYPYN